MHESVLMQQVKSFDFYLLRLPLLSYNTLKSLHSTNKNEVEKLAADIREIYTQPLLQEAIYLASQELYSSLMPWLAGNLVLRPQKEYKLILTLYKYLLRMCARCTPYGLFAGCSVGSIENAPTSFKIAENAFYKVVNPDMHCILAIADGLLLDEEIAAIMVFLPNSSIYRSGNSYRYYEYQLKDNKRNYFLSSFSHNIYLEKILTTASNGATLEQLIAALADLSITADEAKTFISMLMDNQILVSAFHPTLTGPDYLSTLSQRLKSKGINADLQHLLNEAQQYLFAYEKDVTQYHVIGELLQKVSPGMKGKDLIQVDLFHQTPNHRINQQTIETITAAIQRLTPINIAAEPEDLKTFRKLFAARYENRAMPLMQVLDSESGIGYGIVAGDKSSYTPLIDDLILPAAAAHRQMVWNQHRQFVLKKFLEATRQHCQEIVLTDEEIQQAFPDHRPNMPATTALMGTLVAASGEELDKGNFRFIMKSCSGVSGLPLLGRFGAVNETLATNMQKVASFDKAQHPEKILAEIIHLPEGRTGNVLRRPQLYDYEIPFLGTSAVDTDHQIPVSDLYVKLEGERIVLFSLSKNKEVIPRLTSAHNFSIGLPVYKFLCDLQHQQNALAISWDWNILQESAFLPRVSYQQIVLSRAQWRLTTAAFHACTGTDQDRLQQLITQHNIPGKVLLAEGDNELLLDLSCTLAQELLLQALRKENIVLYETFVEDEHLIITSDSGPYCNEIVVPLYNSTYTDSKPAIPGQAGKAALKRSFAPGSEWLYAKIYCGTKSLDKLLTREIYPLVAHLKDEGIIDSWFFLRYQDPEHHLRIRVHMTDKEYAMAVMQEISQLFNDDINNDIVSRVQFDTYIREIERYGSQTMELCESIFHVNSELVLELLPHVQSGNQEFYRWIFAVKSVAVLLEAFGLTNLQKQHLLTTLQESFFREFNGDHTFQVQLNEKYRKHRAAIAGILDESASDFPLADVIYNNFKEQRQALDPLCTEIRIICSDPQSLKEQKLQRIIGDLVHMQLNRFFVANQRLHELVVYHSLAKHYSSVIAREQSKLIIEHTDLG
ncbi:lantibiotic dehydratase [Chitinophaga sp. Cy-1792]|uniref:lantibiotic dehydratase n=1 Tax=Chitinophaga sp. Cy-1792 TaxID=2608339 RepID=UPI00141F1D3C|nr:lantibiotic dehydratase [Chitinophaga sp. Cy-1792]NIG56945.1 hypothetical protein [Chitinophaga sp. Cy-1792]